MNTSQANDVVAAALAAEEQRRQALLAGDMAALEALLSDGLVYVHSTAVRDGKDSYLAKLRGGGLKYLSLAFDELQACAVGDAVVVTGRMSAEIEKDGQRKPVRSLFMTVWAQAVGPDGRREWRLHAHQGTPCQP